MPRPTRSQMTATTTTNNRHRMRAWLVGGLAVLALGAAACDPTDGVLPGPFDTATGTNGGGGFLNTATLDPFDGCDALLAHIKAEATERVGPYGIEDMGGGRIEPFLVDDVAIEPFPTEGPFPTTTMVFTEERAGGAPQTTIPIVSGAPLPITDGGGDATSDADFSETNNQESGVDEPDLVKLDSRRMVVLRDGKLSVFSLLTAAPSLLGVYEIPGDVYSDQMFLYGDKVLLMSTQWREVDTPQLSSSRIGYPYIPTVPHTVIQEINIANPARMQMLGTLTVDGTYLSARMIGGVVRLVVQHAPDDLGFVYPSGSDTSVALRANREVIQNSTLDQWLSSYTLERNGRKTTGRLAPCTQVHEPSDFSGFNTTTVLTVNLSEGLNPGNGVSVLAQGEMVYASTDSMFIATNEWARPNMPRSSIVAFEENYRTDLHKFSLNNRGLATYEASGSVEGHSLNQFSLSEHEGNLRVATTEGAPWMRESVSSVTVLEQRGSVLAEIGRVGGLGKGERIQSVRFVGDRGYVVTFRQIDPLYVVDLSDPTKPTVTGELKIPGFSSYLHPIEGDQLIGIGRDVDPNSGRDNGLQVSLFDVSDPTRPQRTANRIYPDAGSDAQWNHRAVTWWEDTDNLIIPITFYGDFSRPVPLPFPGEPIPVEPFPVDSPGGDAPPVPQTTTIPWPDDEPEPPTADFAPYEPNVGAAVFTVTPSSIVEEGIVRHTNGANIDRSVIHNGRLITLSWSGIGTHQLSDLEELGWLPSPR